MQQLDKLPGISYLVSKGYLSQILVLYVQCTTCGVFKDSPEGDDKWKPIEFFEITFLKISSFSLSSHSLRNITLK